MKIRIPKNTNNVVDFNSSFFIKEKYNISVAGKRVEEESYEIKNGACFSHLLGNAVTLFDPDGTLDFLTVSKQKDLYLGISRRLKDLEPTGLNIYTSEEKESEKESQNFWNWISLVDSENILGLDNDILLDSGCSLKKSTNAAFEEYENESILKISYPEKDEFDSNYKSQIFNEQKDNQVLFRDDSEDGSQFQYFLVPLTEYETGENRTELAIVNFEDELLTRL